MMPDWFLKALIPTFLMFTGLAEIKCVEISPKDPEVILILYRDFSLTCSSQNEVFWKKDNRENTLDTKVEKTGNTYIGTLILRNVTGNHTGEYSCTDKQSSEEKSIYIFVPDPSLPFLPSSQEDVFVFSTGHGEDIIPCRVTDPTTPVTLYEKRMNDPVPSTYNAQQGFKGYFEDTAYVCRATLDEQEFDSETFYVYSIQVPSSPTSSINISISAAHTIVKQGENISVTCSVRGIELINYTWSYPGQKMGKEVIPLTRIVEGISHYTSSSLIIHNAGLEDEGLYTCEATETYHVHRETQSIFIRVIDRGFVTFLTVLNDTVFAELHKSHTFSVEIEAYPAPTITWLQNNQPLDSESKTEFPIVSKNLSETRYQTTLTLVRVKQSEGGLYTVRAFHDDAFKELSFYLQINGINRCS